MNAPHRPGLPSGTVTFLFTDIEGSTALWEQFPEAMRSSRERHDSLLSEEIAAHGGRVYKTVGDAFQAAFVDAAQAMAAAVAVQCGLSDTDWGATGPLRVRIGIHVGQAEAGEQDYVTTPTLNRVARIMAAAHGGQILVSQSVADLVGRTLDPARVMEHLKAKT